LRDKDAGRRLLLGINDKNKGFYFMGRQNNTKRPAVFLDRDGANSGDTIHNSVFPVYNVKTS
jgi:hypothetical protein